MAPANAGLSHGRAHMNNAVMHVMHSGGQLPHNIMT